MSAKSHSWLAEHIASRGNSYPKKHGAWVILFITPRLWFSLDSYSQAIRLCYGVPVYNKHTGFSGTTLCYLGLNFGGYESSLTNAQYSEILSLLA